MLFSVMLFWIGYTLTAPTWFWWCWGIIAAIQLFKFGKAIYDLGKKSKEADT